MARIRSISPDLRTSETCAAWPREVRYAWALLWGYLDDYGRGLDNARVIAADCFPLDDDVTADVMGDWLDLFEKAESICRYEYDGKRYLHAVKWGHWQKPQHPGKVRVPPCDQHEPVALAAYKQEQESELMKVSGKSHEGLMRVSPTSKEEEGEVSKEKEPRGTRAPRCPLHLHHLKNPPCGQCKELRIAWENEKPALSAVPMGLACPKHRGQLAGTCSPCRSERIGVA